MDAVKFLKERARMCGAVPKCKGCPFHTEHPTICMWDLLDTPDCTIQAEAVSIVEKWSNENPLEE